MSEGHATKAKGTTNLELMFTLRRLLRGSMASVVRWIRSMRSIPSYAAQRKRENTISDGMKACPKTLKEVFCGDDKEGWKNVAAAEMNTLTEMGVFDHGYTMQELHEQGITKSPILRVVGSTGQQIHR